MKETMMIAWKASIALLLTISQHGMVKASDTCLSPPTGFCLPGEVLPLGEFDLLAGQSNLAGGISITTDEESGDLVITFDTDEDWCLLETHVQVFPCDVIEGDPKDLPQPFKNGNPAPGQFDYKHENLNCEDTDDYTIEIGDPQGSICIATHAVVESTASGKKITETAWGGDNEFPGKSWATYIKPEEGPCIYPCEFKEEKGVGLRYRELESSGAEKERYVGQGDLGVGRCRAQSDTVWGCNTLYPIELQYVPTDGTYGTLYEYFNGATTALTWGVDASDLTSCNGFSPPSEWDSLKIQLRTRAGAGLNGLINFKHVKLNGVVLGDFCGSTTGGFTTWTIYPVSLGDGFVVEGDFEVTNTDGSGSCNFSGSNEGQKFEITTYKATDNIGCPTPAPE